MSGGRKNWKTNKLSAGTQVDKETYCGQREDDAGEYKDDGHDGATAKSSNTPPSSTLGHRQCSIHTSKTMSSPLSIGYRDGHVSTSVSHLST